MGIRFKLITLAFTLIALFSNDLLAQQSKIKLKINNIPDNEIVIAYHSGQKQFIFDTILFKNGQAVIERDDPIDGGIYLAVIPSMENKYFEFIIAEQKFTLETTAPEFVKNMKTNDSKENKLFYDYMRYLEGKKEQADELNAKIKEESNDKKKEVLKDELQELDKEVKAERLRLIELNPGLLYANLLNAMREVEIPEHLKEIKDKDQKQRKQYTYYKSHYWDHINFTDQRLLKTPVFMGKLKTFFEKTAPQHPDSLAFEADRFLYKARANDEIFKHSLVWLLNKYAKSKIMCMDKVYVHLVESYYAKGDAPWVDSVQLFKIVDRARSLQPTTCGQIAPDVNLPDIVGQTYYRLHDIDAEYTIIFIWDPDCGHCKKEAPKLGDLYNEYLKGINAEIYAISTVPYEEVGKWKKFVEENNLQDWIHVGDPYFKSNWRSWYDIQSTPVILVIDKNKKIIAKRIAVEQMKEFLEKTIKNN